ncbi:MAG: helix-turn-helix domain-containing protein [Actinobacteria bacterium]|nr:helix-turn-helix domain-containing protein [Actinomycetota bacterium]
MGVIGDTLSEARTRRAVDLEEIHAATGIRPRYLRAIEQEDWDALPEEFYARSFIRKYARYLDLDPDPLVADYRRQRGTSGALGDAPTSPFARTTSRRADALRRRRKRQGVYAWLAAGALVAVVVVVLVLIASGGGGTKEAGGGGSGGAAGKGAKKGHGAKGGGAGNGGKGGTAGGKTSGAGAKAVSLEIEPTAEVWACVLDAKGKPLVDGQTLAAGETMGPFKSRSYTAAFGNGSVEVRIDGKRAQTLSTPSPIGLAVTAKGKVHEIPEGERPSCE